MDQCQIKCRALTGINQGQAYDCAQPCESGQEFVQSAYDCTGPCTPQPCARTMVLTANMTFTPGSPEVFDTANFYVSSSSNSDNGVAPPTKVVDGEAYTWDPCAKGWAGAGPVPYQAGDEYNGNTIADVVYTTSFLNDQTCGCNAYGCGDCEECDSTSGECSPLPPPSCNSDCCVLRRVTWTRDDGNGGREQVGGINEYRGAFIAGSPTTYTSGTSTCVEQLIGVFNNSDTDCSDVIWLPRTFCGGGTIGYDNWQVFISNQYNGFGRNDCPCEGPDFDGREATNQNYGYCPGDGDYQP